MTFVSNPIRDLVTELVAHLERQAPQRDGGLVALHATRMLRHRPRRHCPRQAETYSPRLNSPVWLPCQTTPVTRPRHYEVGMTRPRRRRHPSLRPLRLPAPRRRPTRTALPSSTNSTGCPVFGNLCCMGAVVVPCWAPSTSSGPVRNVIRRVIGCAALGRCVRGRQPGATRSSCFWTSLTHSAFLFSRPDCMLWTSVSGWGRRRQRGAGSGCGREGVTSVCICLLVRTMSRIVGLKVDG